MGTKAINKKMVIETISRAEALLTQMKAYQNEILAELDATKRQSLLELTHDLRQYAVTIQDGDLADLLALSRVIYRFVNETPELREMPALKKVLSFERAYDVEKMGAPPLKILREVDDERERMAYVNKLKAAMTNNLLISESGAQAPACALPKVPTTKPERTNWLLQILQNFLGYKDK